MPILYRKYKDIDLFQVQKLMEQLGYAIEINDLKENIKEIISRKGHVIIADEKRNVIGIVCVIIDARLAEGIYAEIVSLIVDSEARGRGVGKKLVENAEAWARRHTNKIRVRANDIRSDAHKFYESLGYDCIKRQKIYKKSFNPKCI